MGAPGNLFLITLNVLNAFQILSLFDLHQLGLEHTHGHFPVLVLAALNLAADHDPGGNMGQAHGRGGLVDLLAAGTGGPVHIHLNIFFTDLHIHIVVNLRHHFNGRKGGMPPTGRVKGRHPHQAVNTHLAFQIPVGILALN